jgi:hypothetical protein
MPTDVTPATLPDSRPLHRLIGQTRRLLRSSWIATGLGISFGLLLGTLAVLAVLDLFVPLEPITLPFFDVVVPLDPILRSVALLLVVVPAVLAFLHGVVRPLFRRLGPTQVARRIETHLPGIHNRLVSAIDLEAKAADRRVSPVFLRRLLNEALDRVKDFHPRTILDLVSLRRAVLTAVVAVALSALAWTFFADRLPTAVARIFMPLADIPPASGVAYDVKPGQADVLRNEEITFAANVTAGDPSAMRLELYGTRGTRPRSYELKRDRNDGNRWRVVVDGASLGAGFEDGFRYRVYGGRTWSKQFGVTLVDRPVIASIGTAVRFPDYMKIPEIQPTPPQAVAVAGPENGSVIITVQSQGDVASGEVQLLEPTVVRLPLEKQQERGWLEGKLPVGSSQGGSWDWTTHSKQTVHTEPAGIGTTCHWMQGDPVGHTVGTGDVLFAYVFVPAKQVPRTIMLEWHDGDSWDHRAFWGVDNILEGRPGTASRHRTGELPETDRWVRLEVPAARVGLEGKTLRGMAFKVNGGQVIWGRTGTAQLEEPSVKVVKTFAMKPDGEDRWTGSFPLVGEGMFRAELKSRYGHPNKPMKEMKYVALPDKPPYVALERKGNETVLSKPAAVPLSIAAFDDYGLDEVRVLFRRLEGVGPPRPAAAIEETSAAELEREYRSRSLWQAGNKPLRNLALEAQLTESAELKIGGAICYLIEARDTKGQTARTREYMVLVATNAIGEDRKLETFDKNQDTFTDKLVKLMADQKKVKESVDKLDKEYAKLAEKLNSIKETEKPEDKTKPADKNVKPKDELKSKLTPEEQKRLAELQKELAKLAGDEERNAEMARQVNEELKKSIDEAGKLDLLPQAVLNQMGATQRLFDKMVAQALKDLGKDLKDSAGAKGKPDVPDLKNKSDRVDKELQGIKDRLDALSNARKGLKEDIRKALAELRDKMAREDGKISARELEELKKFIEQLRQQLQQMKARQGDLANETEKSDDVKSAKAKQEDLEKQLEDLLAKAKKLLQKKDRDRPEFPDAPFRSDDKEVKVPPREEDGDDPLPKPKEVKSKGDKADGKNPDAKDKKDMDDDEEESKFMPRLGGPREKLDPRFAKKRRPFKKGKNEKGDKEDMEDRQNERGRDLDAAEKSLKSDQQSLADLLDQLQNAIGDKGQKGKNNDNDSPPSAAQALADELRKMMQSPSMQEALAMAAAAKMAGKGQRQQQSEPRNRNPMPNTSEEGNLNGGEEAPGSGQSNLNKLDPATRAMILKMPPSRYREELIRGLAEKGPEAYRAFIQDYFKRLTETKKK